MLLEVNIKDKQKKKYKNNEKKFGVRYNCNYYRFLIDLGLIYQDETR